VADTFDWKTRTGSYLGPSFLIDFLTPDEYWHFVGQTYELSEDTIDERLAQFADFYVDEPIGETTKYIRDLSTGNQNKAGLIAALLPEPDLLVFDEPFASLDPRSQIQLKDLLQERRGEATILISSHDLGHVTDVSDRIAILEDGEIVRDEPTDPDTLADLTTYFAETIRPREKGEPADAEA
jgi:ABC-2 type transport system ATP-binding protein